MWTPEHGARATAHVLAEARRLRVEVVWKDKESQWQSHESTRLVWVPYPTSGHRYMVALHELGHIASRVARRWGHRYSEPGGESLVEGAAWAWAAMAADPDLVEHTADDDWAVVGRMLGTYLWNNALVAVAVEDRVIL